MKPKLKVFISQRMKDLSDDIISENRKKLTAYIEYKLFPEADVEIVDSYFEEYPNDTCKNKGVWYLGKSLQKLSEADAFVIESGAEESRGCKIEMNVADAYGIDTYVGYID